MVKVATSLDVPIKLLWPKSLAFSADRGFTMLGNGILVVTSATLLISLGLGDVVVPGIFIALALRFDHHRAGAKTGRFAKPYFHASLAAYVAGLVTTMTVMVASNCISALGVILTFFPK
jgi:minor histocompatibility antigen H13